MVLMCMICRVMTANSSLPAVPGVQPVSQPLPLHTSSTEMSSSASENRTKMYVFCYRL